MKIPSSKPSWLRSKVISSRKIVRSVGGDKHPNRQSGMTLIELLIVVAIIGILSQVALPSYSKFIVEQRRADAHHLLQANAQLLQRCLTLAGSYAVLNAASAFETECNIVTTSKEGHYELASTFTAQTWTLDATPVAGGKQQQDADCTKFTLNHIGVKSATGSNPDVCW